MRKENETEILDDDFQNALQKEEAWRRQVGLTKEEKIEILEETIEILTVEDEEKIEDPTEILEIETFILKTDPNEEIEILDDYIETFEEIPEQIENTLKLRKIELPENPIRIEKKIKPRKGPWFLLLSISSIIIVLIVYKTFFWQQDSFKTNKQIENIVDTTLVKEIQSGIATENVITQNTISYLEVDFTDLLKQNAEVKGWIKVKNTNINYPFVQTQDNEYYLKHSFDKSKNSAGWVFADFRNNLKEWDQNTILYAHGRLDNTMFGSLKKVIEPEWYEKVENRWIQISTQDANSIWQVFSVYTIKPETYYITPNFESEEKHMEFLNTLKERSVYDFEVELTNGDKILTLSSCYNNELRVVLHAKLVKEEKR